MAASYAAEWSPMASVRRRKRKQQSCSSLRRKARRIKNPRKRSAAMRRLPKRCRRVKPTKPKPPTGALTTGGTQPPALLVAPPSSAPPAVGQPGPPPGGSLGPSPIGVHDGAFGVRQAERLLWRAGFGPAPGQAADLAALGLDGAVAMLTRPTGPANLIGPEPTVDGEALDPNGTWGHDHLWWMDRMLRSDQPLVERMTLVFHDWFSTSNDGVGDTRLMFGQTKHFRDGGLGNFGALVRAVTTDPAMLIWLSGLDNRKHAINENYGRELMELFTLGADRGAYTETDVREIARALSGWTADWDDGWRDFRFAPSRHDAGDKTVFGQTGAFGWEDACQLVVDHPLHPSFFVTKLWSYFIPTPPSAQQVAALSELYVGTGHEIRPVLEAILRAPELYGPSRMVKPPIVFAVGMLRTTGQSITSDGWAWMCSGAGQQLFYPPDVSGWDDTRWLDTSTMAGRWILVNAVMEDHTSEPRSGYPKESGADALAAARAFWNDPELTDETVSALSDWANTVIPSNANGWMRAYRANALKMLVGMCPDHHTS